MNSGSPASPIRRLHIAFLMTSVCALLNGCMTNHQDSNVKYGYLADFQKLFVRLPDGATIAQCGGSNDDLNWAVNTWGAAIKRSYAVIEDCELPDVKFYGPESRYAKSECNKWHLAGRSFARHDREPREIVTCPGGSINRVALLHEVGHLFGLCDQYEGEIQQCAYTTSAVKGSVMYSAETDYLTSDDINGIQSLAAQLKSSVSSVLLLSGTYSNKPVGIDTWKVTSWIKDDRTSTLEITAQGAKSVTTCSGIENICDYDNATARILDSRHFRYEMNGLHYDFFLQSQAASGASLTARDASPGRFEFETGRREEIISSDGPIPEALDQRFFADHDHLASCTETPNFCTTDRTKDKNQCWCRYFISCNGIQVPSFCTAH